MLRNFLFNLSGTAVPLLIALLCIPIYLRYIGVAGYGIVGIYQSIAMLAGVFDVAFSNTINRELARRAGGADGRADETGTVFRTLELFAWGVASALAVLLVGAAPYIVQGWIGADKYQDQDILLCVQLMGLLLLLQAPLSFYSGCLYGLHKHGLLSALSVSGTILSASLAIAALALVSPTVETFLVAQFAGRVTLLGALIGASYWLLRRETAQQKFTGSLAVLRRLWRFAVGMNGVGILTLLATQADMLVLTRVLSATGLGHYTVARTISQGFFALAMPAYQSAFPHLTRMLAAKDMSSLIRTFHRYCQLLAIVLIPAGVVTVAYAEELLLLWTRNADLADTASLTLSLLVAGSVLSGLNCMMSALQMAYGAVRLVLFVGVCFVVLVFPALVLLAQQYGASGAALAWLLVNAVSILLSAALTTGRLLKGQFGAWLMRDMFLPMVGAILAVMAVRAVMRQVDGLDSAVPSLALSAALSLGLTAATLPAVRETIVKGSARAWKSVAPPR